MARQARLDVLFAQRLAQQRILHQVNLPYREVVGSPPIRVDLLLFARVCRTAGNSYAASPGEPAPTKAGRLPLVATKLVV
jgi:hypothetical protein